MAAGLRGRPSKLVAVREAVASTVVVVVAVVPVGGVRGAGGHQGQGECGECEELAHRFTSFRLEADVLECFGGTAIQSRRFGRVVAGEGQLALDAPDGSEMACGREL